MPPNETNPKTTPYRTCPTSIKLNQPNALILALREPCPSPQEKTLKLRNADMCILDVFSKQVWGPSLDQRVQRWRNYFPTWSPRKCVNFCPEGGGVQRSVAAGVFQNLLQAEALRRESVLSTSPTASFGTLGVLEASTATRTTDARSATATAKPGPCSPHALSHL